VSPLGDPRLRGVLADLADRLVPAADGMPAATAVGAAGEGADRVLALRPDLAEPVARVLAAAADRPATDLAALRAADPEGFAALGELVAGAYFTTPSVAAALGYPGRPARPLGDLDAEARAVRALAEPQRAAGPRWRVA
jgi:hypothetical protein